MNRRNLFKLAPALALTPLFAKEEPEIDWSKEDLSTMFPRENYYIIELIDPEGNCLTGHWVQNVELADFGPEMQQHLFEVAFKEFYKDYIAALRKSEPIASLDNNHFALKISLSGETINEISFLSRYVRENRGAVWDLAYKRLLIETAGNLWKIPEGFSFPYSNN